MSFYPLDGLSFSFEHIPDYFLNHKDRNQHFVGTSKLIHWPPTA